MGTSPVFTHPRLVVLGRVTSGNENITGYTLLSSDLIQPVLDHGLSESVNQRDLVEIISELGSDQAAKTLDQDETSPLSDRVFQLTLHDSIALPPQGSGKNIHVRLLDVWDTYKDENLVTYQDTAEELRVRSNTRTDFTKCRFGPRLILGIMSVLGGDDIERHRRRTLRDTYLNYFKQSKTQQQQQQQHRICALWELLDKT